MRPDQTNRIDGANTEDKSLNEGTIFYDIRFNAVVPNTKEPIGLIVNIEAQNQYMRNTLPRRSIYYCSRLISSQYGKVFDQAHYEKLKKVYSIWIFPNATDEMKDSMVQLRLDAKGYCGDAVKYISDYDLIRIMYIFPGKNDNGTNKLLQLLGVLFSRDLTAKERLHIFNEEFDIPITSSYEREMENMCNLSQGIRNEGIKIGRVEGLELGKYNSVKKIMKTLKVPFSQAAQIIELTDDEIMKFKTMLEKEQNGTNV